MCRADVAPTAVVMLVRLLEEMAGRLAAAAAVDPSLVRIGPVDFGPPRGEGCDG